MKGAFSITVAILEGKRPLERPVGRCALNIAWR